jgi:hypothetical protein
MNREVIEWRSLEYEPHEKGSDWYWILGIVVVIGALIAIVFANTLFSLLIVLSGFIIGLYASKHPDTLYCAVDRRGIHVNRESYLFKDIDSFWIDESRPDKTKLLMTMKNKFAIQVAIPLEGVDIDDLHDYLSAYIHEEEQNETISEQIMEWLKI